MTNNADYAQGGFDRGEFIRNPHFLDATNEIAAAERQRVQALRGIPGIGVDFDVADHVHMPGRITASMGQFLLDKTLTSSILTSFRLNGIWSASNQAEAEILKLAVLLDEFAYATRFIARNNKNEADIVLRIVPEQTIEPGFVALQRTRNFGTAMFELLDMPDTDPRFMLKFEKNSLCTINLAELEKQAPAAANEANLIIAANLLRNCRLDYERLKAAHGIGALTSGNLYNYLTNSATDEDYIRLQLAANKIANAQIPDELLFARLLLTPPLHINRIWSPVSVGTFERGIENHLDYIAPSANTYSVFGTKHRKSSVQWGDQVINWPS